MVRLTVLLGVTLAAGPTPAPSFTDVFVPATDGFASIRIPSMVVTTHGTVLAFAEGRAADADQAANRIILKRSTDGGRSWSRVTTIARDGDRSLNNPCAVVEHTSGRVLLMYQSYPAGISERSDRLQPGYVGDGVVRVLVVSSDDDGKSWSPPRDVTRETKRAAGVTTVASGPGIGVQLERGKYAGRLVIPFNEGPYGHWQVYAVYSDDRGKSWQMGGIAPGSLTEDASGHQASAVNEAQLVELSDGAIRFNVRRAAGTAVRKTAVSRDGGATWSTIVDVPDLRDPGSMASVLRYSFATARARNIILFSGPQSTTRDSGTAFISHDDGRTWPIRRLLWPGSFAYSVLTRLPDGTVGCLFEADDTRRIVFARFAIDWISDEASSR